MYKKIADLGEQIAKLNNEADEALLAAAKKEKEAAGKTLVLATRARDLAAAQLAALKEALDQAKVMVDQAIAELERMEPQLRDLAGKIRDAKHRSFVSGIIKAAIQVVGVVASAFVGPGVWR